MENQLWVFLTTFGIIFLAEIGDKTNLVAISLSAESEFPKWVLLGGALGLGFISGIGVLFAVILGDMVNVKFIPLISGSLFLLLGIWELKEYFSNHKNEQDERENTEDLGSQVVQTSRLRTVLRSFSLIGLAEFGDKSQLFLITSALSLNPFFVLLGGILGLFSVLTLSVIFGKELQKRIPRHKLELIVAVLFLLSGLLILSEFRF